MIVVKTKYGSGVPKFGYYMPQQGDPGHRIAIMILDQNTGERLFVATVNLDAYPGEGCVFIKDWSENEGMDESVIAAGLAEPTDESMASGYVFAQKFRLTALALAELARQNPIKPELVEQS